MAGGFGRSKWFGLIGVLVVAAIVIVIATTTGGGEANPKLTMGLIFGVLAVFFVILLALQRSDLERAAASGARGTDRAAAEGGGRTIENPTTMAEPELWAALAVKPIDDEAVRARTGMWDAGRRSQRLGMVVVALIFLTVPPVYLLESFVPLLIGGPLIVIVAVYGGLRAVGPGGEMDRAYEKAEAAMAPLGLAVTERPRVGIETREPTTGRMGPRVRGTLALEGERHGRPVSVRLGEEAGARGVVVTRKGGEQSDWMCDLWLAERLAGC